MADTRGTFRLKNVRQNILNNEYVPIPSVWLPAPPLNPDTADTAYWGAFGGGGDSLYKIPVPSDTWSLLPANLGAVNAGDATGSQTAGFISGGYSYSRYKKLTYSSDTTSTAHPGGGNAYRNYDNTAITDGDNGYWLGGERVPGGAALSSSEKLTYASSTVSAGPNLPETRAGFIGSTGSTTTGYMCGGATPGRRSNMFKLVYSSSTMSTVPGAEYPAPIGSGDQSGNGVTDTHGYFVGGHQPSGAMSVNCKLTYSNETFAREPGGNLPRSSYYLSTTGSRTVGYWGGGESPGSPNPIKNSNVHKLTYSNSTFANVPSSIQFNPNTWGEKARGWGPRKGGVPGVGPVKRWVDSAAAVPNDSYAGTGGSPMVTFVDRLDMATDTAERVPGMNAYNPTWIVGSNMASSPSKGYYHGTSPGGRSSVFNIIYATDSRDHAPGLNTTVPFEISRSTGNSTAGYIMGGQTSSPAPNNQDVSMVHKMTYSSDTTARIPGANLQPGSNEYGTAEGSAAISSSGDTSGAAYLTGGRAWPSQSWKSTVWKMSYATETTTVLPAKLNRQTGTGHSNNLAGYYGSGPSNPYGDVMKMPWSTETWSSDGGTGMHRASASGGNQEAAYAMGGISASSGSGTSAVRKFTYATSTSEDVANLTVNNPGNNNRQGGWGTGPRTCNLPDTSPPTATPTSSTSLSGPEGLKLEGYIGKGRQPGQSSGNDGRTDATKFSYSTETFSASASGNMPNGKKFPGATSNTTRGYWAGGTPGSSSIVDKFVWSTNTGSTIPATLGSARSYASSAAGNQTQGYFTFGSPGSYQNACDKLVYSSETMSNLPSMPFKSARAVAISMQTAGYYGSGAGQDDKGSYFTKITFATDTKSGNLPGWRASGGGSNMFRSGSSSSTKAYVCCGESTTRAMEATPWATDSVSQLPTTFMPADATGTKGQGDNTNAYFTGGPGPGGGSMTQRVVYSNDTVSVLPGANFPGGVVNAYGAGGPGMNGIASSVPNVI